MKAFASSRKRERRARRKIREEQELGTIRGIRPQNRSVFAEVAVAAHKRSRSLALQATFNHMVMLYTEFDLVLAAHGLEESHPLRKKAKARLNALAEPVQIIQPGLEMLKTGNFPSRKK